MSILLREEDMEMRTEFDFGPLFRSSVGFHGMLDTLQRAMQVEHTETYPPMTSSAWARTPIA